MTGTMVAVPVGCSRDDPAADPFVVVVVVRYAVVPWGTSPVTRAVVVVFVDPVPFIGAARMRVDPFWLPAAVRITVPLLILPIGGRKRLSLILVLLLGIKLMVLLLMLLLLLLPLFIFTLLELLVGMIETSLFNLWGGGGGGGCCCCSCSSRN